MKIEIPSELAQVIIDGMDLYVRKHGIARAAGAVAVTGRIVAAVRQEQQMHDAKLRELNQHATENNEAPKDLP